jgi:outer membrane protein OmpA-like peptidoglycan-associated protein
MRAPILALLLTGCVPVSLLQSEHAALKRELEDASGRTRCKPQELALAEANLAFAEVEFDEASLARASEHLKLGRSYAAVANTCPERDTPRAAPAMSQPSAFEALPEPPPKPVAPPPVAPPPVAAPADKDGDGMLDADDICPADPEDLDGFKDADGCPELDNDGDSVLDSADRCATQAEDRDGFEDADGCPETDNDRDGVADTTDKCPNEAGAAVDGGCPSRDRDRDGVADSVDACPDGAETVNDYLDTDGCPDQKPSRVQVTGTAIEINQKVNFATGKDVILPDSFGVLDDVAQAMRDYPKLKIEIGGHTDNVGDDAKNQKLSKERADAVFEYLLSKGIAAPRMMTMGYGETRPVDTNRTDEGRSNNRRVEFLIVGGAATPAPTAPTEPVQPDPLPW